MDKENNSNWIIEISPRRKLFDFNFKEIWNYRDLLILFVKRDITAQYKQTILGPLWFFIQPVFTSIIFTIIFNTIAEIQTGKVPPFLFNLISITTWNYFSSCLTSTADTFKTNANLFGKVYFPRIIMPLSIVVSNLVKLALQMLLFFIVYGYYFSTGFYWSINTTVIFFPIIIIVMALLGLGMGMIVSSMVTKYRDLIFLLTFFVQLFMYVSAVNYPIELVKQKIPSYSWIVNYNPMSHVVEITRYMFLSEGNFTILTFLYAIIVSIIIFLLGLLIFNQTEKTFIDTV
jgi:lipopolysaccharide transport system permease protein